MKFLSAPLLASMALLAAEKAEANEAMQIIDLEVRETRSQVQANLQALEEAFNDVCANGSDIVRLNDLVLRRNLVIDSAFEHFSNAPTTWYCNRDGSTKINGPQYSPIRNTVLYKQLTALSEMIRDESRRPQEILDDLVYLFRYECARSEKLPSGLTQIVTMRDYLIKTQTMVSDIVTNPNADWTCLNQESRINGPEFDNDYAVIRFLKNLPFMVKLIAIVSLLSAISSYMPQIIFFRKRESFEEGWQRANAEFQNRYSKGNSEKPNEDDFGGHDHRSKPHPSQNINFDLYKRQHPAWFCNDKIIRVC